MRRCLTSRIVEFQFFFFVPIKSNWWMWVRHTEISADALHARSASIQESWLNSKIVYNIIHWSKDINCWFLRHYSTCVNSGLSPKKKIMKKHFQWQRKSFQANFTSVSWVGCTFPYYIKIIIILPSSCDCDDTKIRFFFLLFLKIIDFVSFVKSESRV